MARTQVKFLVHTSAIGPFSTKASVAGKEMDVTVDGLVVELVSEDGSMSQTLRILDNAAELAEAFVPGAAVTATFTVTVTEPK